MYECEIENEKSPFYFPYSMGRLKAYLNPYFINSRAYSSPAPNNLKTDTKNNGK